MNKFKVNQDCYCEGYLHEITHYWRPDLKEKKLYKNDIVSFIKEWTNYYGTYHRVQKGTYQYDILPEYLIEIKIYYEIIR